MLRRVYLFGAPKIHPGAVPLRVPLRGLIIDMGGVKGINIDPFFFLFLLTAQKSLFLIFFFFFCNLGIDPEGLSVFKGILEELKSRETQVC